MKLGKKFLILSILTLSLTASAEALRCESLFDKVENFRTVPKNLREIYISDSEVLSVDDVAAENKQILQTLRALKPALPARRSAMLPLARVTDLLNMMQDHKVVGFSASEKYDQPDVSIGYCFGRATFAHLMLLKMGVQKESVLKIWAVGEMQTPKLKWDFHVATITYTPELGWVTVDTNHNIPLMVDQWMDVYQKQSTDQKLRFYVTPAEKFSFEVGKYDRVQMGLDLERKKDWYKHYFVDLIKSVRETDPVTFEVTPSKKTAGDDAIGAQLSKAFDYVKRLFGF